MDRFRRRTIASMSGAHSSSPFPHDHFATTRWSLVAAAGNDDSVLNRGALEKLCSLYWYPIYGFVRRQGFRPEQAEDLTQEFFAMLLDRNDLAKADQQRGRFRSFLLTAVKHHLLNQLDRDRATKRGGRRERISIDFSAAEGRYTIEPTSDDGGDVAFQKQWALLLLERTRQLMHGEYATAGNEAVFLRLLPMLTGDGPTSSHAIAAAELGMTEGAVKVALHRMRKRFGERLREQIAETVDAPDQIEDEVRELFEALRR